MRVVILSFSTLFLTGVLTHAELVDFGGGLQIDFTTIGDAGNAADTTGSPNPAGSVGYDYRISTYEISRDQVTAAGIGITLTDMSSFGGNGGDRPATGISWYEAAQFVNHLNTSVGAQAAYKFDGLGNFQLWDPGDAGYDASNLYRNSLAEYWLPDVDEWYKAAYYDPNTMSYFDYPTGSNTAPTAVSGGTTAGTAVYGQATATGPADVTNAGGLSPYGVMGLGGNVWEWEETAFDLTNNSTSENRAFRGGPWDVASGYLRSSFRNGGHPPREDAIVGFRVAGAAPAATVIPEPSTVLSLWLLGGVATLMRKRRLVAAA